MLQSLLGTRLKAKLLPRRILVRRVPGATAAAAAAL